MSPDADAGLPIYSRGSSLTLSGIDEVKSSTSSGFDDLKSLLSTRLATNLPGVPTLPNTPANEVTKRARPGRRLKSAPRSLSQLWAIIGVDGDCIATLSQDHVDHALSLRIGMPLLRMTSPYILTISFVVRTLPMDPWALAFSGGRCALARLVPTSHPFMAACQRGDVVDVRKMLQSGEGRLSDVDERQRTPLAVSRKYLQPIRRPLTPRCREGSNFLR